jgi:hypothetical protein
MPRQKEWPAGRPARGVAGRREEWPGRARAVGPRVATFRAVGMENRGPIPYP